MAKKMEFDLGEFNVRITPKMVDIETNEKDWKIQFGKHTREYAQIMYLLQTDQMLELKNLTILLYTSRLVATNTDFLKMFQGLVSEFFKKSQEEKQVKEDEDKGAVDEEKLLHEKLKGGKLDDKK